MAGSITRSSAWVQLRVSHLIASLLDDDQQRARLSSSPRTWAQRMVSRLLAQNVAPWPRLNLVGDDEAHTTLAVWVAFGMGGSFVIQLCQHSLGRMEPQGHVHGAIQCDRRGQLGVGLFDPSYPLIQDAKTRWQWACSGRMPSASARERASRYWHSASSACGGVRWAAMSPRSRRAYA